MSPTVASIRYNLIHLARFSGRASRGAFWPYAGLVLALVFISLGAVMVPFLSESMVRMQRFAAAHPDQSTVSAGPGQVSISIRGNHPELMPDFSSVTPVFGVILLFAILLLGAAVARRLHDRNWRGFWGLLPVPFITTSLILMPGAFAAVGDDDGAGLAIFFAVFFSNILYLASLGSLVLLLVGAGTAGPNRFGPPPDPLS